MSVRPGASRRVVLRGAVLAPVAGVGVSGCKGGADDRSAPLSGPVELGPESEIAEGGAKLYRDHNVVVSRTGDGTLKAYDTVCTHAGCPINKLDGTKLICPCHGSEFDATTGKVLREPAVAPLQPLVVEVENGTMIARPQT
ncbi:MULTISPECIES: Rieske (2Fe-2S) protein [unclassified Streptomyces]|uniref:Rieske (2Fe-2S) protein n=1 Tax=unclassified Streptomyces TaxID=2593676 RepID=UPI000A987FB3|nr:MULTISPECIES: Rieske (2Fe-2S) protein [unclassified Streptomyces]AZM62921.1 FeS-binding protein [Streptomyces sp. WAC 01438]RSN01569.1 FeS-binding protein [Streptomyces sp. WAC 01420]